MENLTLLEQEALGILKQLEFSCVHFELCGGRKEGELAKGVEIPVNNIELTALLQKTGGLDAVERFLKSNGLNFSTSFDIIKRPFKFPDGTITEKTVSGIIKGENIQDIKTRIRGLIDNLSHKKPIKPELKIKHNIKLGQLIFNDDVVSFEGKQKDTISCLVSKGKDVLVSWDEIYDLFNDSVTDQDTPNSVEIDSHKRSVRTAITEINSKTNKYFQPNNELIGAKNNEYWLQYEVDKGR